MARRGTRASMNDCASGPQDLPPHHAVAVYGLREALIESLSASILLASPKTASRRSTSQGPCGSLKVAPKAFSNGVWPLAAIELKITRRGSAELYLFLARSGRATTLPPLATVSICASSPTTQARKFQAASTFLLSL